jgi:hypothetical protein
LFDDDDEGEIGSEGEGKEGSLSSLSYYCDSVLFKELIY